MTKFRVSWWIHGAGRIVRGSDIVEATELTEEEAEQLIQADLDNIRESEPSCYSLNLPNFQAKHHELTCAARHSEISNWRVMRVVKVKE